MKKLISLLTILLLFSCSLDDVDIPEDYIAQNEAEILAYLDDNSLTAQKSPSGLYYIISTEGTGVQPSITDNVTVAYKGYFIDGQIFDQSDENGISFNLGQVIAGWTEGITYFKEGGEGILLIPSHLAYGNTGRPGIPPGSVLVFDISLLSVD